MSRPPQRKSRPLPAKATPTPLAEGGAASTPLKEGDAAPSFSLPRDGGGTAALKDFHGRKLVVFFYPRADTPGCTREAADFSALASEFEKAGTAVIGLSADSIRKQESFQKKHKLTIPLLSDEAHEVISAFGAWGEKSMYGKTFEGVLRTTVLIDTNGRVARLWRNVKVEGHAAEVLAAARVV